MNQTACHVQETGFVPAVAILPNTLKLIILETITQIMYK